VYSVKLRAEFHILNQLKDFAGVNKEMNSIRHGENGISRAEANINRDRGSPTLATGGVQVLNNGAGADFQSSAITIQGDTGDSELKSHAAGRIECV